MNIDQHTPDQASDDFARGREDGYMGYSRDEAGSEDYDAGYDAGERNFVADQEQAAHDAYDYGFEGWDNPVEQGMYDDDPNPYHGDY